jgi:hypothetical protein
MEILRVATFLLALSLTTSNYSHLSPLPFTWIFKDFAQFIFDPICVSIFYDYMLKKEKQSVSVMNDLMKMYLLESKRFGEAKKEQIKEGEDVYRLSSELLGRESKMQESLDIFLHRLYPCYERFQRTKAFEALREKVKEYEVINQKVEQY